MFFVNFLSSHIGDTVEVAVPNETFIGKLTQVTRTFLQLTETSPIYGPPGQTITVPYNNVDFVRVFS